MREAARDPTRSHPKKRVSAELRKLLFCKRGGHLRILRVCCGFSGRADGAEGAHTNPRQQGKPARPLEEGPAGELAGLRWGLSPRPAGPRCSGSPAAPGSVRF